MTLQEIYIRLYNFSVTQYQECLLVGFTADKVDFVIKEIHNEKRLKQKEIEELFSQLSKVGEQCECTELRILAYGGWIIDSDTLSNNPYQYQGKTLYNTEYYNSLLTGRHIELFAHNEYAYTKVKEGFETHRIGAVVQATGTGKSFIISRYISELPLSDEIAVIAPNVVIFEEIKNALRLDYGNVDFLTFQGLAARDKEGRDKLKYKHIIIDEFHHAESEIWGNAVSEVISNNQDANVLGTTATPLRPSDNINVVETIFEGNLFHEFNLSDAIRFEVLPIPKVIQSVYNLNEVVSNYTEKLSREGHTLTKDRRESIEARLRTMRIAFDSFQASSIIQKHIPNSVTHLFVFCSNIEELRKMKKEVLGWFDTAGFTDVHPFVVYSDLSNKKNLVTLEQFQRNRVGLSLLFSVDMLSEGLHVRHVDGALFLRKTSSYIVCLQQLGRTLKAGVGAQPIILDFVNNISNAISYETLFERGSNPIDQIITSYSKRKDIFKFIVNDKIIENVSDYIKDIESLWNLNDNIWDIHFSKLTQYLLDNNGQYPLQKIPLGKWVHNQRQNRKKGIVSQNRIDKLDSIGFDWAQFDNLWDSRFIELTQYLLDNNGQHPTSKTQLGTWVNTQQKSKKKSTLLQERIEKLDSIGFDWGATQDESWDTRFQELKQYLLDQNGQYPAFKTQLGHWVIVQRQHKKKSRLSQERIDRLDSIGFDWGVVLSDLWGIHFNKLVKYLVENDGQYPAFKTQLGHWVIVQRYHKKKSRLSQERIDRLDSIGFDWGVVLSDLWNTRFTELVQYLLDNNGQYPAFKIQLGKWVTEQRYHKKKSTLSQERIEKLDSINFNWNSYDILWDTKFLELEQYLVENDGQYPKHKTQLGTWLNTQRSNKKKGKLSQSRIDKLDSIGFDWGVSQVELNNFWDSRFIELTQYILDNNGQYPKHKTQLNKWVSTQRQFKNKSRLSQERIERLDSIGFKWNGRE